MSNLAGYCGNVLFLTTEREREREHYTGPDIKAAVFFAIQCSGSEAGIKMDDYRDHRSTRFGFESALPFERSTRETDDGKRWMRASHEGGRTEPGGLFCILRNVTLHKLVYAGKVHRYFASPSLLPHLHILVTPFVGGPTCL